MNNILEKISLGELISCKGDGALDCKMVIKIPFTEKEVVVHAYIQNRGEEKYVRSQKYAGLFKNVESGEIIGFDK